MTNLPSHYGSFPTAMRCGVSVRNTYNVYNITMSLTKPAARCPPPIIQTSGIRTARVYNNASLKYILRLL